ncbi:type VI secretion system amidase effector protein Tae4 [Ectopseudomonas khazarica]|uniref:type VI secretion system amidase effector protein Tae4 n=1 Tax=Ectopseudomonas khazarica TaxID=2502979 RepID=UPI00403368CA
MLIFKELWESHPTITGEDNPCTTNGQVNFSDQCAIRIGVALNACGVDTSSIPGVRYCWHHKKSAGHILAAEELAVALTRYRIPGLGPVQKIDPSKFKDELISQRGIIFFKDYWLRQGESFANRSGDHIDLWNGTRLTDWFSWARIQAGFSWQGTFSDFEDSKQVWFWKVL